jgi:amino acid transporter
VESASAATPTTPARAERDTELDSGAIGFFDALVIGLNSTAPAYSLAAVIGSIVLVVGLQAPAVLIASFIPMFLIASSFYFMNRVDPDCGTTFSWVTRALGPWAGWMGGWAICTTGILVVGSLADVGARYTYLIFGADGAADSRLAVVGLAVAFIVIMTAICVIGTELSARAQNILIIAQVLTLLVFAGAALIDVYTGGAPAGSVEPELSWFLPWEVDSLSALVGGLLIGVFIYWGWESAVNLTEETRDGRSASGLAALLSTVILLVTYLAVSAAVVGYGGPARLGEFADDEGIFSVLGAEILGSPWDKLVLLAIITSALASTRPPSSRRRGPRSRWPAGRRSPPSWRPSTAATRPRTCRRCSWRSWPSPGTCRSA